MSAHLYPCGRHADRRPETGLRPCCPTYWGADPGAPPLLAQAPTCHAGRLAQPTCWRKFTTNSTKLDKLSTRMDTASSHCIALQLRQVPASSLTEIGLDPHRDTLELRPWSKRGGGMLACKECAGRDGGSGRWPFVYGVSVSSSGGAAGMRGVPNAPEPPKPAKQSCQAYSQCRSAVGVSDSCSQVGCRHHRQSAKSYTGQYTEQ